MIDTVRDRVRVADAGWRTRLSRRLVSYAAAVAINIELVVGPPRTSYRSPKHVVTWNLAEPLINGVWSRRELASADGSRVVVCDFGAGEKQSPKGPDGFCAN